VQASSDAVAAHSASTLSPGACGLFPVAYLAFMEIE